MVVGRMGLPFSVAPRPRTAEKSSSRIGSYTTPTWTWSSPSTATLTEKCGSWCA